MRSVIGPGGARIVLLAIADITDRKRSEQETLQRAEELRIANAELLAGEERKNQFLAMLSHELRNPLAPVTNALYILNHVAPDSDEAVRARAVMGRQVGQLSRLVDDLLDATRLTHGKIQLRTLPIDLVEVVTRAVDDHRSSFVEKSIELESSIPHEAIRVQADRARITQVIGNLLNNAVKFSVPGGKITVSVATDADDVVVRVRDTGPGIAPDMLSSIFDAFTQVDATIDRAKGGLGLGLSLVRVSSRCTEGRSARRAKARERVRSSPSGCRSTQGRCARASRRSPGSGRVLPSAFS